MTDAAAPNPLRLFNSLTRSLEVFEPVHPGEARVYSCGPTVYNYQHIGNMRAYVFADTLGRTLQWKGYKLTHVVNITDVGHLTSDADEGEDKMEKMAAREGKSAWDIAKFYQADFETDLARLNVQPKQHPRATEYVAAMIEWGKSIADKHCYELESGLYFDTKTVRDYGRLAGHDPALIGAAHELSQRLRNIPGNDLTAIKAYLHSEVENFVRIAKEMGKASPAKRLYAELFQIFEPMPLPDDTEFLQKFETITSEFRAFLQRANSEGRIDAVQGKRNEEDFAIWRKTPAGETRQMEWDSPWGRGAPGWHLECSVMGEALLGFPFDIHTGGIDHREIHHPNEIAQNQAFCCTNGLDDPRNSGAKIWMHNNFLVERSGKMSKSSGEFLRLQLLIDRGYHPLAYRLMCLQAHYRSELEFSWEGLGAALTRLKRMVMAVATWRDDVAFKGDVEAWRVDVQRRFDQAISEDLNTPVALTILEEVIAKKGPSIWKRDLAEQMDKVLGLGLLTAAGRGLGASPLPLRGGAGGGGAPAGAAFGEAPHPNPTPKREGLV